jgi:hypothetical protein
MRKIDELINGIPGRTLFHYTSASGLLGILKDGVAWASSAYHLNDTGEYRYAFDLIADLLNARIKFEHGPFNERYGNLLSELDGIPKGMQAYVASFSEEGDLLSQWLSYPQSPNGYAIGLSASHFIAAREKGFTLMPCIYDHHKQSELANAVIDVLLEAIGEDISNEQSEELVSKALTAAAAIKHPGFEREAEWRLVKTVPVGLGSSKDVRFRQGRNGIVPYVEAQLTLTDRIFRPTAIHVGPNEDMASARIALNTFLDSRGWGGFLGPKVEIEFSKTPYRP